MRNVSSLCMSENYVFMFMAFIGMYVCVFDCKGLLADTLWTRKALLSGVLIFWI